MIQRPTDLTVKARTNLGEFFRDPLRVVHAEFGKSFVSWIVHSWHDRDVDYTEGHDLSCHSAEISTSVTGQDAASGRGKPRPYTREKPPARMPFEAQGKSALRCELRRSLRLGWRRGGGFGCRYQ